jgi:hypothetical protein
MREMCWLIEDAKQFFTVHCGSMSFTEDKDFAIKFLRKEDAELMLEAEFFCAYPYSSVVEFNL